ncbi:MAG TPA: RecX family transcriptional regulator [Candidatus Saccharimonadales bacterium]|nr:RecX family transcriptional regulator [Candidatus Saccharimonadales bacterium]
MKLTAIKKQINSKHRFSIYVDNKYSFSLGEIEILKNGIKIGQELSPEELKGLKQISAQDKLYARTLKLVAARPKSEWEVTNYLSQKDASPALIKDILNKLSELGLIDDYKFAEMYIRDITHHSPASRRKILSKLKQKRVKEEAIEQALQGIAGNDQSALDKLIETKHRKYPDKMKLMAYLSRQGFSYPDIKSALDNLEDD